MSDARSPENSVVTTCQTCGSRVGLGGAMDEGTQFYTPIEDDHQVCEEQIQSWAKTAKDELNRRLEAESQRAREFREASIAVWREIDRLHAQPGGYKGLAQDTDLRIKERRAWERYREELDRG